MLVLAGLARISGHFLVVFQVMFGFYHVNLLLCIINQIIQQNSLINTMYKREKATTVTRGMYSSSKHWTVNENMAKREEGCLHRVHLLIITYITSNDVCKALSSPTFHYAQDSMAQLRFYIWRATDQSSLHRSSCFKGAVTASFSTLIRNRCLCWSRSYASHSNTSCHLRLY